jgi:hypothetical protein
MKDAYLGYNRHTASLITPAEGTKQFHEQVQVLTKNRSSLNTIFMVRVAGYEQSPESYESILRQPWVRLRRQWKVVLVDAKKAHDQIALLANNLGRLNNFDGNMLSAMQGSQLKPRKDSYLNKTSVSVIFDSHNY